MRTLPLCLLLLACSPAKPAASPEQCKLIEAQFATARDAAIDGGACDRVERIESCPAYMAIEQLYVVALEGGQCR